MSFDPPKSRNEAILQNMLGANNALPSPKGRIEELLLQILQQGGGLTPEQIEAAIEAYLEEHPIDEPFEIPITESGGTYSTTATAADILANAYNCEAVVNGSKLTLDLASVNGNNATLMFNVTTLDKQYPEVTNVFVSVSNGTVTVTVGHMDIKPLPTVTASDNGKILGVVNGAWTKTPPANALVIDFNSPYASAYDDAKAAMQGNREVYLSIPNSASNPTECIYLRANAWNATYITFGGLSSAYIPGGYFIMTYAHITSGTSNWFKWTTPFYFNPVLLKHLAPVYDSIATYSVGDYVTYGEDSLNTSSVYRCTTAINTPEDWNSAHWTAVTVMDEVATLGGSALFEMILDKRQYSGSVIVLTADQAKNVVRIESENEVTFVGDNIFDASTAVVDKILNDSGVEIRDTSSFYYSQMIPVRGKTITANFPIQRLYYYDKNKQFLKRTNSYAVNTEIGFPTDVYFAQIQIKKPDRSAEMCVVYGGGTPTYSEFRQSDAFLPGYTGGVSVFGDGVHPVTVAVYTSPEKDDHTTSIVEAYPFWEPETVTDDYKCTFLGTYTQSIPALTNTLKYQGFLETYFDVYLGTTADGYTVSREDLGLDSGAAAADHIASPVYSYTFAPKRYSKTVLLSAGMNTNEASTYFGIAYFIKALMEHTEPGMLALYQSTRFVVIPVICPSGIAHDPLLYRNSNNVRINKNFEYYGSWERLKSDSGGPYPDSEIETKMLKAWLNKYAGADFWLDCHSDTNNREAMVHLGWGICSDEQTAARLRADKQDVIGFYRGKGYYGDSVTPTLTWSGQNADDAVYPKHVYSKEAAGIPSCMFEQYLTTTVWGSDGTTNNDAYGIKHYTAMIRYMVLIMTRGGI